MAREEEAGEREKLITSNGKIITSGKMAQSRFRLV